MVFMQKNPGVKEKGKIVDMLDSWADRIVKFQLRFNIPLIIILRGTIFMGIPMYLTGQTLIIFLYAKAFCYVVTLHHNWYFTT
jgi:hypothetical protein